MIDINLVPVHLRKQHKSQFLGKINIPLEIIIGCGGGLIVLLALVHVLLLLVNIGKLAQHKSLQGQWETIKSDKENVDSVVNQMRIVQTKFKSLEEVVEVGELSWSQKLNLLSDSLPRGIWFKKVALTDNMLFIEGSAIAQDIDEIASVGKLIANIKESEDFMKHFSELELGSIQKHRIKNVEIADFVVTMKLK